MFGSVTSRDIVKEFYDDNINISAKDVILKSYIKNIGEYEVEVVLHPEVISKIKVYVRNIEESVAK